MAEQDQNRNEAATPFKLDEARKRGSVAKSMDLSTFGILLAGATAMHLWGGKIAAGEARLFTTMLSNAHQASFELDDIAGLVIRVFADAVTMLAPLFLVVAAAAILVNFLQTGPVLSFFPLKPDLERINPIAGFKRVFSFRLVVESVKTVLKFVILGVVLYYAIQGLMPRLLSSLNVPAKAIGHAVLPQAQNILGKLLGALALITLIDVVYSRWDFSKRMRMSRRDIQDESKRREGEPRVKSRLRELQREAVKRAKSLGQVKEADVLITNPVHLAIAVKYDRERIDAPLVIAKGAGFLAARMRSLARRHKVPVVENRPLARALFHKVGIDQAVPVEHYAIVARILVWAYALRRQVSPGSNP